MAMVVDHGLPGVVNHDSGPLPSCGGGPLSPTIFWSSILLKCVGMYVCYTLHIYSDHTLLIIVCLLLS